jgi:hypothetical protein
MIMVTLTTDELKTIAEIIGAFTQKPESSDTGQSGLSLSLVGG